jgi:hypothetical protein
VSRFVLSRRQLLGAAAATTVAGMVLGSGTASGGNSRGGTSSSPLVLLDGMLTGDDLTRARAALAPFEPRILQPDLLWHWRRELAHELANGRRALAITRWDKAIVLRGLAREAGLPLNQRRIGRSLFQTEIEPGTARS